MLDENFESEDFHMEELALKTGNTLEEIQELKEIFQLVDLDHGGTISRDELETLMKTVGLRTNNNDMQLMMSEIDPTGSGEIDFDCTSNLTLCRTRLLLSMSSLQLSDAINLF